MKSLTMLAAVIASLQTASNYGSLRNRRAENDESLALAAKSTLVIVPSACKACSKTALESADPTELIDNWIAEIEK